MQERSSVVILISAKPLAAQSTSLNAKERIDNLPTQTLFAFKHAACSLRANTIARHVISAARLD